MPKKTPSFDTQPSIESDASRILGGQPITNTKTRGMGIPSATSSHLADPEKVLRKSETKPTASKLQP